MSDEILDIPPLLKRLANDQVDSKVKSLSGCSAKFQEKYINTRPDGTKVYMYQEVEGSHRLYEDGTKVYSSDLIRGGETERKWVMPERKPRPLKEKRYTLL